MRGKIVQASSPHYLIVLSYSPIRVSWNPLNECENERGIGKKWRSELNPSSANPTKWSKAKSRRMV